MTVKPPELQQNKRTSLSASQVALIITGLTLAYAVFAAPEFLDAVKEGSPWGIGMWLISGIILLITSAVFSLIAFGISKIIGSSNFSYPKCLIIIMAVLVIFEGITFAISKAVERNLATTDEDKTALSPSIDDVIEEYAASVKQSQNTKIPHLSPPISAKTSFNFIGLPFLDTLFDWAVTEDGFSPDGRREVFLQDSKSDFVALAYPDNEGNYREVDLLALYQAKIEDAQTLANLFFMLKKKFDSRLGGVKVTHLGYDPEKIETIKALTQGHGSVDARWYGEYDVTLSFASVKGKEEANVGIFLKIKKN